MSEPQEIVDAALKEVREGRPYREIARRYLVHHSTVQKWAKTGGVRLGRKRNPRNWDHA